MSAEDLVQHLTTCREVGGVLVGDDGVDLTPNVAAMLAAGWTWEGEEIVAGRRVRYLRAPLDVQDAEL